VIPVQRESAMLEGCVESVERFTTNYNIHIMNDAGLNVSEARQAAMDTLPVGRYVCFLDDDSRMIHDGWLDALMDTMVPNDDVAVAFAEEMWGDEFVVNTYNGPKHHVEYGPAACMLIDTERVPDAVRWNKYIGLRSGWLGGDFEEVEYAHQLMHHGKSLVGVHGSMFKHIDRPPMEEFRKTDRAHTCVIMQALIRYWAQNCPDNGEFFQKLRYVKANENNDCMLAPGQSLKKCFHGVLADNHLRHFPMFKTWGIA